jgi:hypothetical protein
MLGFRFVQVRVGASAARSEWPRRAAPLQAAPGVALLDDGRLAAVSRQAASMIAMSRPFGRQHSEDPLQVIGARELSAWIL